MCKVIKIHKQSKSPPAIHLSNEEALDRISQIAWDDPEAFFTLAANCLPHSNRVGMNSRIKSKLIQMDLIDYSSRPPVTVRNLILDIVYDMGETLTDSALKSETIRTIC